MPLFLYGHHHHFEDKTFKCSRFVNVSALGEIVTVRPEGSTMLGSSHLRNAICGSYVIIEIDHGIDINSHSFHQNTSGWEQNAEIINGRHITSTWPDRPLLDAPFKSGRAPLK